MAFPTPLYVLLKGGTYLTLADVIAETREDILNTDQTNYRDTMDAAFQGGFTTVTAIAGAQQGGAQIPLAGSLTAQTDEFTHTIPRNTFSKRTMIRWWKASGASTTFTGTTVLNSAVIAVSSIAGLYAGQAISGTGIPAGAIIQEVRTVLSSVGVITFSVISSLAATAAGAVTITATNGVGDLAGECWADRFIGWSSSPPAR